MCVNNIKKKMNSTVKFLKYVVMLIFLVGVATKFVA